MTEIVDGGLKDGIYRLSRQVENPKPDNRKRYDWTSLPVWAEGMEFIVLTHEGYGPRLQEVTARHRRSYHSLIVGSEHRPVPIAFLDALVPVEDTLAKIEWFARSRANHYEGDYKIVLAALVDGGYVRLDDVTAAILAESEREV